MSIEQALKQSEQRFRLLMEKLPAAAYTCDAEGLITYYNPQAAEVWGRAPALRDPKDRFCGSFKLFLPGNKPIAHDNCWMARALKTGKDHIGREIIVERPDGSRVTVLAHASPLHDETGKLLGAINILVDITERKQMEEKNAQLLEEILRRSEQLGILSRASQQMNSVLDVAIITRTLVALALEVVDAEGGTCGLMQDGRIVFTEYNSRGQLHPIHLAFDKDDRYGIPSWVLRQRTHYLSNDAGSDSFLRPDLRDLYGIRNFITIPIFNRQGDLIACFELHNKRHGEPFTDEHVTALRGLAAATAVALENARLLATVREADQRKDEFLAILSHELRNPLAPIRNALHLLRNPDASDDMRAQARTMMERQVDQMVRLVDDLLDVSRITCGKIELRKDKVELAEIVRSAVETVRPLIEERRHTLKVTLPPQPILLEADATRLAQIFSNLLNNAAKYTEPGGEIELAAEERGDDLLVRVRDNGIGIGPDMLPRIFDMFAQVNSSLERSQGGLGIGLTLVRKLVEMHGGHIEAASEGLGKGSIFSVRLPVAVRSHAPASPGASDTATAEHLRVLVVDDNEASAKTMGWTLELLGHEVRLAHEGVGAIAIAKDFRPHVVLLDIGLPGMNGYDVCSHLRREPEMKGTVFIAQTGWGQEEHRRQSREAGFDHHLVKPVRMEALQEVLAGVHPRREAA